MGRTLIVLGAMVIVLGCLIHAGQRFHFLSWLGRLPGDIRIEGQRGAFYFPFTTCIILTVVINILLRSARFLLR